MTSGILDVNSFKAALVLLSVLENTNSPPVPSSSDHHNIAYIKLDIIGNLVGLKIKLDGVDVWNSFRPKLNRTHFAKLELQQCEI
uniref:Uncharacterized protein n=1 Tax=Kalanchoe fedtschenkoi TaxID=63787 RepID=A0A7N0TR50_KALFE